jgi:hypothetical protein
MTMNSVITKTRSLTTLGACLALAASAQAQLGSKNPSPVTGKASAGATNQAPVCNAGPATFVECTGQVTAFQLDGSLSYDPDGDPITFEWVLSAGCPGGYFDDPHSPTPIVYFDPTQNCLEECGGIKLRVSDGKKTVVCGTAFVVHDLMPPVLTAPLDVVEPFTTGYPTQASAAVHGTPAVFDCDPNAVVGYTDTVATGPIPSGVETIINRLWRSVDECGNVGETVQVIVFVAPAFFAGAPVDLFPGSCNNLFLTGPGLTTFDAGLLDEPGFAASQVQLGSLRLQRADGQGVPVSPLGSQIVELGTPSIINSCASAAADTFQDVLMTFDQNQVAAALLLDQEPTDGVVVVKITGKDANGKNFKGFDLIRVFHLVTPTPSTGGGPPPQPPQASLK